MSIRYLESISKISHLHSSWSEFPFWALTFKYHFTHENTFYSILFSFLFTKIEFCRVGVAAYSQRVWMYG